MVLIYESDPLDDEDARGRFYHVCRGRIDDLLLRKPRPRGCDCVARSRLRGGRGRRRAAPESGALAAQGRFPSFHAYSWNREAI